MIEPTRYKLHRPVSDERFATDAPCGVELACAADRAEPSVDIGGLASQSRQPTGEGGQSVDEATWHCRMERWIAGVIRRWLRNWMMMGDYTT